MPHCTGGLTASEKKRIITSNRDFPVDAPEREDDMKKGYLVLQDGQVFEGFRFGGPADAVGELVFTTCLLYTSPSPRD